MTEDNRILRFHKGRNIVNDETCYLCTTLALYCHSVVRKMIFVSNNLKMSVCTIKLIKAKSELQERISTDQYPSTLFELPSQFIQESNAA
eukprot:CAMPEP_0196214662 /NCGR_PEP_ID=MMETSP0912-20130531/27989_1 /TAXON_ID=49265 /ORGANISM="Thalassiosira rotula, Strain GSO102" /LENGTH=89 /DNA_ID=CAMNT_0041491335 /DNA_START=248 /DNA_END=514 /DNA_ORIENTATION=-